MLRVTFLLRRREGLTREEFQHYWKTTHGPLMAGHANDLDVLRYVQCHTTNDHHPELWGPRGEMEDPYDGVAEVWWESRDAYLAMAASDAGRSAGAAMLADEHNFIDLERSTLWAGYEHPQINSSPENIVATEHNSIVKLYFPLRHLPALELGAAQHYWRTHHGPIIRRHGQAMSVLRYVQVHRDESEIGERLCGARGCGVEPFTGHAELWLDRANMDRRTPERLAAGRRAYDDESTFIDFGRSTMFWCKEHVFVDRR